MSGTVTTLKHEEIRSPGRKLHLVNKPKVMQTKPCQFLTAAYLI